MQNIAAEGLIRSSVRFWMRNHISDYANETELVEGANCEFKFPQEVLDDETHWVWELAYACFAPDTSVKEGIIIR